MVALVLWAGIALSEKPTLRLALLAGPLRPRRPVRAPRPACSCRSWSGRCWRGPAARLAPPPELAAAATAATAAVIAPWTALNLTRFQEPVAISMNDGLTLIGANCDTTYFDVVGGWNITPCASDIYKHVDEHKAVEGLGRRCRRRLRRPQPAPAPVLGLVAGLEAHAPGGHLLHPPPPG